MSRALGISRRCTGFMPAACLLFLLAGCSDRSGLIPGSGGTPGSGGAVPGSGGMPGSGGLSGTGGATGGTHPGIGLGGDALGELPGDYELPVVTWPSEACVSQVSALLAQ